jgi:hypothetical protein
VIFGAARFEAAVQQTFDIQAIRHRNLLVRGAKLGVLRECQEREERKKAKSKKKADFHKRSLNRGQKRREYKTFQNNRPARETSPYGPVREWLGDGHRIPGIRSDTPGTRELTHL